MTAVRKEAIAEALAASEPSVLLGDTAVDYWRRAYMRRRLADLVTLVRARSEARLPFCRGTEAALDLVDDVVQQLGESK